MNNLARLEKLEDEMKAHAAAGLWVDLIDDRVRVDVAGKRGDEIEFESVYQCVAWVEKRMRESDRVRGLAFISNVTDLFLDEPFTYTPDDEVNQTGVLMNLSKYEPDSSLAEVALATWLRMHGRTATADAVP